MGWFRQSVTFIGPSCFWIVVAMIVLSPFEYWAVLNTFDSTDYFLQEVDSAIKGDDNRSHIYVGDDLHVRAYNWRHRINGSCLIQVDRLKENVGGIFHGKRFVFQRLQQQFVGDGVIRRTSWPIPPQKITINETWLDDPTTSEQEMDIFTTGTFDCNPLDRVWLAIGTPRVHHNAAGEPWREKTRVVLHRKKAQ